MSQLPLLMGCGAPYGSERVCCILTDKIVERSLVRSMSTRAGWLAGGLAGELVGWRASVSQACAVGVARLQMRKFDKKNEVASHSSWFTLVVDGYSLHGPEEDPSGWRTESGVGIRRAGHRRPFRVGDQDSDY